MWMSSQKLAIMLESRRNSPLWETTSRNNHGMTSVAAPTKRIGKEAYRAYLKKAIELYFHA